MAKAKVALTIELTGAEITVLYEELGDIPKKRMGNLEEREIEEERVVAVAANVVFLWRIAVGGGYGDFLYVGSPEDAEDRRVAKARWEGAVARKREVCRVGRVYLDRYLRDGPFVPEEQYTMAEMLSGVRGDL